MALTPLTQSRPPAFASQPSSSNMHFLMCPLGTAGDIHPFLAIGCRLQQRGHRVSMISHTRFGPLIRSHGLDFIDLNDEPAYSETHNNPDVWHPRRGSALGARFFLRHTMRPYYKAVADRYVPGRTITVSNHSGFGGRMAHDHLGVPYVTLQTSPAYAFSVLRPPRHGFWSPSERSPLWLRRTYFWIGDRLVVDPLLGPEINRFRAELGLPPVRNLLRWQMSPQRIIGLFPKWFSDPRPEDWPAHLIESEFPLFDDAECLPDELAQFLRQGDPPIVFTPGTGVAHAADFFKAAVEACLRLGRRGLLLSRTLTHIPPSLPDRIRHFSYAPLGALLPHAAAMVYHGGIGTLAQTIRAGLPHVVMPMAHDQPDNADRLVRLGVGRLIWRRHFTGASLAQALRELLTDPDVSRRCRELAQRIPADPVAPTVELLERFAQQVASSG